jgi:5-formyltetrahydrofolate cyclo-ligase
MSAKTRGVDPFDAETLADLKFRAKKQLRTRLRGLRSAHPEAVLARASAQIVARVLAHSAYESAGSVGLFWPLLDRREVDVRPIVEAALASGKRLYFPYMQPHEGGVTTGFARVDSASDLVQRGQRFLEPDPARQAERGEIDLLIVPALGAAADGHRLGYGSGFYDATLPDYCPPGRALVVIYDFQLLAELPATDGDVAASFVVTEKRTLDAIAG